MKNVIKMILVGSLLATFALAKSAEETYVESYAGRADIPVPISVVQPLIDRLDVSRAEVRLSFVIDADGAPRDIQVPEETDRELSKRLTKAVAQWRFKPLTRDGASVRSRVVLPIHIIDDVGDAPDAQR